jgi:hypothetical protein
MHHVKTEAGVADILPQQQRFCFQWVVAGVMEKSFISVRTFS